MYEMQGTSPWPAASGQPVAWPSRRGHAARQSQEPALGSGCPAPPTSRSRPRAVPVSNGESISTASARDGARPAPHLSPAFFLSTRCPQNMAGYPQLIVVFHRPLHRSSTGYQALPGETVSCHRVDMPYFRWLSTFDFLVSRENDGDYPAKFGCPFRRLRYRRDGACGRRAGSWPGARPGSSPGRARALALRATMRKISRGRRHCRRRVRPGEGR
jgi:hypothetical protein